MSTMLRLFPDFIIGSSSNIGGLSNPKQFYKYNRRDAVQTTIEGSINNLTTSTLFKDISSKSWVIDINNISNATVNGVVMGPTSCNNYGGISIAVEFYTGSQQSPQLIQTSFRGGSTSTPYIFAAAPKVLNIFPDTPYRLVPDRGYYSNSTNVPNIPGHNGLGLRHPGVGVILDAPISNVTKIKIYVAPGPGHNSSGGFAGIQFAYGAVLGYTGARSTEQGLLDEVLSYSSNSSISYVNSSKISEVCGVMQLNSPGRTKNTYSLKLSLVSGSVVRRLTHVVSTNSFMYAQVNPFIDGKNDNTESLKEQLNSCFVRVDGQLSVTNVHGDLYDVDLKLEEL